MIDKIRIKRKNGFLWYNLRCPYCQSNYYVPYFFLRLKFLIYGETKWYHHCQKCHKVTAKRIMFNVVNDHTDKDERIMNGRKLWDSRIL